MPYRLGNPIDFLRLDMLDTCAAAKTIAAVSHVTGTIKKLSLVTTAAVSSGTTNLTVKLNGTAVDGLSQAVDSSITELSAMWLYPDDNTEEIKEGDVISLESDGTGTGTDVNASITIYIDVKM